MNSLPPGPFQITPGIPYDAYAASPVHRAYQMWQQLDCNVSYATPRNPSGCKADLFPWVETTIGAGSNGLAQSPTFNDTTTGEGSTSMGFYLSLIHISRKIKITRMTSRIAEPIVKTTSRIDSPTASVVSLSLIHI